MSDGGSTHMTENGDKRGDHGSPHHRRPGAHITIVVRFVLSLTFLAYQVLVVLKLLLLLLCVVVAIIVVLSRVVEQKADVLNWNTAK